jgi:hypothetical protein
MFFTRTQRRPKQQWTNEEQDQDQQQEQYDKN